MASKKEYSDAVNKLLGTSIDWTKLSQDDLVQFATLLNNPQIFLEKLSGEAKVQEYATGGIIRELAGTALSGFDGPIAQLLKGSLKIKGKEKEEK